MAKSPLSLAMTSALSTSLTNDFVGQQSESFKNSVRNLYDLTDLLNFAD